MSRAGEIVQLTNDFLISALSEVINQEKIRNYDTIVTLACEKGDNYYGVIYRVEVKGIRDGNRVNLSLILKIPPSSQIVRDTQPMAKLYIREAFVYNVTLPELCKYQEIEKMPENEKYKHLKCYKTGIEEFKEFLILEDGLTSGFTVPDRKTSFGYEEVKVVLKHMAQFHALSFVMKKRDPEKFQQLVEYTGGVHDFDADDYKLFLEVSVKKAVNAVKDKTLIKKLKEFGTDDLYDRMLSCMNPKTVDDFATLCHADSWASNLMIKYEENKPVECKFLDWQTLSYSSPIVDIAFFIFCGTEEALRKKHFTHFMDHYHECLAKNLSYMDMDIEECYPKYIFQEHLKKILPFGLAMTFILLPAVAGEAADAIDLEDLVSREKIENLNLSFSTTEAGNRFSTSFEGILRTFIDLNLI